MIASRLKFLTLALLLAGAAAPAAAQDSKTPYWASIRVDEVNMRVGPGEDYRISWVYRRPLLPVRVLRLKEGWRLVEDPSGEQGWMLARFLSRTRGGIVKGQGPADLRDKPGGAGRRLWQLAPGIVGQLGDCSAGWCEFDTSGRKGFVPQERLWGAGEP